MVRRLIRAFVGPLIALLALLLAFGCFELGVRAYNLITAPRSCSGFTSTPFLSAQGYSMEHGHYPAQQQVRHCARDFDYTFSTDKHGFRGMAGATAPTSTLAVGDSFTFGFGVQDRETFAYHLGAYNAGVFAAPFPQQIKSFEYIAQKLSLKTVLWDIYPPHIITMTPSSWARKCPGTFQVPLGFDAREVPLATSLYELLEPVVRQTAAFALLRNRSHISRIAAQAHGFEVSMDCYFTKEGLLYTKAQNSPPSDELTRDLQAELDAAYAVLAQNLKYVADYTKAHQIELFLTLIPSKYQLKLLDDPQPKLDGALAFQKIRSLVVESGIDLQRIIDLTPVFSDRAQRPSLFFEVDAHWTAEGHRRVGEFTGRRIREFPVR